MKIGIFGGTFNPIHYAHLIFAQEALEQGQLDKVVFVPAAYPSHREVETSFAHRLEMVGLAIVTDKRFWVSDIEQRYDLSYTRDTIAMMKSGGSESDNYKDDDLYLIIGGDHAVDFLSWHGAKGLLANLAGVICMVRGKATKGEIVSHWMKTVEWDDGAGLTVPKLVDLPANGLSATQVRKRVYNGQSIRYMVPDEVRTYIQTQNLYRGDE